MKVNYERLWVFTLVLSLAGLILPEAAEQISGGNGSYNVSVNSTNVTDYINLINGTNITFVLSSHNLTIDSIGGASVSAIPDGTKVNKSGDNMTGNLYNNNSFFYGNSFFGINNGSSSGIYNLNSVFAMIHMNSSTSPAITLNDPKNTFGIDYMAQFTSEDNIAAMVLTTFNNNTAGANTFYGLRFRGNSSYVYPVRSGDTLFGMNGRGSYLSGALGASLTGSKAVIAIQAQNNWSISDMSTKVVISTVRSGTTGSWTETKFENGNITLPGLAGAGNAYPIRSDANGKLVVNRSAGAGITMKSPSGNVFCATVSDAGAFTTTAGECP